MTAEKTYKRLTGAHIKWMAIVLMLVDHIGAVILEPLAINLMQSGSLQLYARGQQIMQFDMVLRALGRFSFPAFCFLLVEGFVHTHSRARYLRNLLVFAVISEIPFNLAIGGAIWAPGYQNVFFTLALGFASVWTAEYLQLRALQDGRKGSVNRVLAVMAIVVLAIAAEALRSDYGAMGVCVIVVFYTFYRKPVTAAVLAWALLSLNSWLEVFCFPMIPAVMCYNGSRGRQAKYFFYIFYPAHLLILVAIRALL